MAVLAGSGTFVKFNGVRRKAIDFVSDFVKEKTFMPENPDSGRRDFVAYPAGAGIAPAVGICEAAGPELVETDVEITTPDGTCDAAFIHPKTGSHPGVLIWPDAGGLRPSMRNMAKRIAAEGYSVLVPNPFYRISKAPFSDLSTFSF